MQQISVLMICLGMFIFFGCGLSSANSIEAKESETTNNVLAVFTFIGAISFICGLVLLFIFSYFI